MSDLSTVLPSPEIQAEQSVLGALLIEGGRWEQAAGRLSANDFADEDHQLIFDAMGRLAAAGTPIDRIAVAHALPNGRVDLAYLADLENCVPSASRLEQHVDRVLKNSRARRIDEAAELFRNTLAAGSDPTSAFEAFKKRAADLIEAPSTAHAIERLRPVAFADLLEHELPPQRVWFGPWLPAGVVTLLAAHGGTGKSTVALMLAVAIAAGRELFGQVPRRGKVLYFSAEDPEPVVRGRLAKIFRAMGIDPRDLDGWLHIVDATVHDPALYREAATAGFKGGDVTSTYADLRDLMEYHGTDVLIVDNASDAFDANEIDRPRVRAFMRALTDLVKDRDGAVLLLAHVDKGTSRGDRGANTEGYSGSTAWHNSARSRIYMRRDSNGSLVIEHQKANLTTQSEPLRLEWPVDQLPRVEYLPGSAIDGLQARADVRPILKLIHEFSSRGEFIPTGDAGRTTAHSKLKGEKSFPKHLRQANDTFVVLRDADRRGLIKRESYCSPDYKKRERWSLTDAGMRFIGVDPPNPPIAAESELSALAGPGGRHPLNPPNQAVGGVGGSGGTVGRAE